MNYFRSSTATTREHRHDSPDKRLDPRHYWLSRRVVQQLYSVYVSYTRFRLDTNRNTLKTRTTRLQFSQQYVSTLFPPSTRIGIDALNNADYSSTVIIIYRPIVVSTSLRIILARDTCIGIFENVDELIWFSICTRAVFCSLDLVSNIDYKNNLSNLI